MKLVVGYLATAGGADAVALGVRLARTLEAELELCIVLPPDTVVPTMAPVGGYSELLADQAQRWLDDARKLVPDDLPVQTHVRFEASFATGLADLATELAAEAIVVGGTGGGIASAYTLGSVVNDLLHSAPVPVAVASRGLRHSGVTRVREVTCAIGDTPGAELLLDTAVRASRAAGTPLRLVSLVALDPVHGDRAPDEVRERAKAHARAALDEARAELPADFPVTSTVVDGPTVEAAVDSLEWHDGDLIMVGSSRLAQPRRLFLGSVAAKMLRVLQVPMVVVPKEDKQ